MFILSGTFLAAQEALQTALQGDRSAQTRELSRNGDSDRTKAGPLEFILGLSFTSEFDDNVHWSETQRESDFIQRPQLDVTAFLPVTKTGSLSLGFGIGYEAYVNNPSLNTLYLTPDSELAYDIRVKDFVFSFYDRFSYSREVETVAALSGAAQFPRFENTAGTRITWAPSRWSYQAGYAHYNLISDDPEFDYLDQSSEQLYARMAYGFAPETKVGVEATVALADYTSATQTDNKSYSLGPYTEWKLTESFTLSVHGGVTHFNFSSTSASPSYDLDTFYASILIDHRLTAFISHGVSVVHQVEPGINQGSDYVESTEAGYRASWTPTRQLTLAANFSFEHGISPQDGSPGAITEDYQWLEAGFSGSQRLSDRVAATASYTYRRRSSNEAGGSPYQNRASIGLRYQF